jgi:hypothetical protein
MLCALAFMLREKVWVCTQRSIFGLIIIAALLFPLSWSLCKAVNYGGPRMSLFLFNSFLRKGVIVETLDRYCPEAGWASCKLRQEFIKISRQPDPDWFMWKAESPLHRLGWIQKSDEPKNILLYAFRCCLRRIIIGTLSGACKQFWRIDSDEEIYVEASRHVRTSIAIMLPNELARFDASKQASPSFIYKESVKTMLLPRYERWIFVFIYCLGLVLMLVAWCRNHKRLTTLFILLQVMLISNSLVCSFAGTIHGRLQGRIAWLTVFCVLLGILDFVLKSQAKRGNA